MYSRLHFYLRKSINMPCCHETGSCSSSSVRGQICPKLHMVDNSPNLKSYTWIYLVTQKCHGTPSVMSTQKFSFDHSLTFNGTELHVSTCAGVHGPVIYLFILLCCMALCHKRFWAVCFFNPNTSNMSAWSVTLHLTL